jgi:hypothetical protein
MKCKLASNKLHCIISQTTVLFIITCADDLKSCKAFLNISSKENIPRRNCFESDQELLASNKVWTVKLCIWTSGTAVSYSSLNLWRPTDMDDSAPMRLTNDHRLIWHKLQNQYIFTASEHSCYALPRDFWLSNLQYVQEVTAKETSSDIGIEKWFLWMLPNALQTVATLFHCPREIREGNIV